MQIHTVASDVGMGETHVSESGAGKPEVCEIPMGAFEVDVCEQRSHIVGSLV